MFMLKKPWIRTVKLSSLHELFPTACLCVRAEAGCCVSLSAFFVAVDNLPSPLLLCHSRVIALSDLFVCHEIMFFATLMF